MSSAHVGIQIGATTAPVDVPEVAREAERLGYGEIWMAEDYFQLGGISSVSTALSATERIPVGLGIVAAAVRHPAAAAMEFATLSGVYRGRFMAGLGHGAAGWVRQMGLESASPLGLLRETTNSIRQLLDGNEVTSTGDYFSFDRVRLHHPPATQTPLYLGVQGPASLRLSGELADGTLLGWFSSPGYVSWARRRINEGRSRANRIDHHEIAVLCLLSVAAADPAETIRNFGLWAAPMLTAMEQSPQFKFSAGGKRLLTDIERMEDASAHAPAGPLLGEFAAVGDPASCAATISHLLDAGADRVVLVPNPAGYRSTADMVEQMQLAAKLIHV
jgi:5,10-methylenetetrahydromethanopterin reductase